MRINYLPYYYMEGGSIEGNEILSKIVSIGFEFESTEISPIRIYNNKSVRFQSRDYQFNNHVIRSTDTTYFDVHINLGVLENISKEYNVVFQDKNTLQYLTLDSPSHRKEGYQYINHTEFKITYLRPNICNNIILEYFTRAIEEIDRYFNGYVVTPVNTLMEIENPYGINDDILVYDPRRSSTNSFIINIPGRDGEAYYALSSNVYFNIGISVPWHPQCTIGIDIIDLPQIITYIAKESSYDLALLNEINNELSVGHETTPLEKGMYMLLSLYMHKDAVRSCKAMGDRDFKIAVRHSYEEVYAYHVSEISESNQSTLSGYTNSFRDVTLFKYEGVILIEIRNFYEQFLSVYINKDESEYPDGLGLYDLREGAEQLMEIPFL